jgi:cyclohexadienyl dehydratase
MLEQRLFRARVKIARSVALAFALAGCERSAPPPAAPRSLTAQPAPTASGDASSGAEPARQPERSRWRVGTTGDYAPFSTRDAEGQLRGFDVDVANAAAADSNAAIVWVDARWPTLQASLEAGAFDIAMSGVSWQPARSVVGFMTRAVGRGGPCVLGDPRATPVGVNRGGVLESWARTRWPERELVVVDDNRSLPELIASGRVRAIVTDSFELTSFARPGWRSECEPRLWRKVYWVAPGREALARELEHWLATHAERVRAAQERWFGERQPLRALDDLSDLMARRLAFMPLVAAAKAKSGSPIEDLPREKLVLDATEARAQKLGLPAARARAFFALQIELAKSIQRRRSEPSALDLGRQIRPALNELSDRILDAVADAARAGELAKATLADLEPLTPFLEPGEVSEVLAAIRAFGD